MSVLDILNQDGFKPTKSTDGMWEPYVGTYKIEIGVLRPNVRAEWGTNVDCKHYDLEAGIVEVLEGTPKRESKYAAFRKSYCVGSPNVEKAAKAMENLLNDMFTVGIELNRESEEALEADFEKVIGAQGYVRAWSWEGRQMCAFQRAETAEKKRSSSSPSF